MTDVLVAGVAIALVWGGLAGAGSRSWRGGFEVGGVIFGLVLVGALVATLLKPGGW